MRKNMHIYTEIDRIWDVQTYSSFNVSFLTCPYSIYSAMTVICINSVSMYFIYVYRNIPSSSQTWLAWKSLT